MDIKRGYNRCYISGEGFLNSDKDENIEFDIIDLSASGIKINSKMKLALDTIVNLNFHLSNSLFIKHFKISAKVIRENEETSNIYGLQFLGLDQFSKIQIDEIMKNKCDISKIHVNKNCEDGHCVFFSSPR